MLNSQHCRSILTRADSKCFSFLLGFFVNVFLQHVPASKDFIEGEEVPFEKTDDLKFSNRKTRKVFAINIFHWLSQSENRVNFYLKN